MILYNSIYLYIAVKKLFIMVCILLSTTFPIKCKTIFFLFTLAYLMILLCFNK